MRESPEGYLSLTAMSLARAALERGMAVNATSEYLPLGYLDTIVERGHLRRGRGVSRRISS